MRSMTSKLSNTDESIEAFRTGGLSLDCREMQLRRGDERSRCISGKGFIQQHGDGTLAFKLYVDLEETDALETHSSRRQQHRIYDGKDFYSLTATTVDGRSLRADELLPRFTRDLSGRTLLAQGDVQLLRAELGLPQDRYYETLHFFEQYEIPLRNGTTTEINGSRLWSLDGADFVACDTHFDVRFRKETQDTVFEMSRESKFAVNFDQRVQEALQFITGRTATWRVRLSGSPEGCSLLLASPTRKAVRTSLRPPILPASRAFHDYGWLLFERYLSYIGESSTTFWHPIAFHLYNARELSAASLDAWASGVCLAVEALTTLVSLPSDDSKRARIEQFHEMAKQWAKNQGFDDLTDRFVGLLNTMSKRSPKDVLNSMALHGQIEAAHMKVWGKLRNRQLHPILRDQQPTQSDHQLHFDGIRQVEILMYQIIFYLINYRGRFSSFDRDDALSVKDYPLS